MNTKTNNIFNSQHAVALLAGLLFGLGLAISEMMDPARVIGFLNLRGAWDPTLAFVMGGALFLTAPGFYWVMKRRKPVCAASFALPSRSSVDRPLIIGAILFGLGWGLAGFCPGPAIAAIVSLKPGVFLFIVTLVLGFACGSWLQRPQNNH